MFELHHEQFSKIKDIYTRMSYCVPVQAVLAGNAHGRVFVDNLEQPTAAFTWTNFGYYYLAGDSSNQEFALAVHQLINDELVEESRKGGEVCLLLYPDSIDWEENILNIILQRKKPGLKLFRRAFSFDPGSFSHNFAHELELPAGFTLHRTAKEAGFTLKCGDEEVCTCDAFCQYDNRIELAIYTAEKYRRKGYATLTVAATIKDCLTKGLTPNWECFWDNTPSVNLAPKLGFKEVCDYPIYYWEEIQR